MFSVIMPVWNRAGTVARAIESVLAQSHDDFELIVVDDGSTDKSEEAIRPYVSSGKVRLIQTSHRGVSAARNEGLRHSGGDLIAYLDSDNLWHPDFLRRMKTVLSSGTFDCAYCLAKRFVRGRAGEVIEDGLLGRAFSFKDLLAENYIDLNTFVHTKRIFHLKGGFDETLGRLTDWDLIIRMAGWGKIVFLPEVLVDYYFGVEENAISLTEEAERPFHTIRKRYPALPEPITLRHDLIDYEWKDLPDGKYRNYWLTQQEDLINRLDYRPYCRPSVIQIEPTNTCNLRCPLCPVGQDNLGRPPRHMRLEEFQRIVDDLEDHVMLLVMWDWGEPFMNPELPGMIRYAAEKEIRTVVSTNAHFLKKEHLVREVLLSGLSTLIVAIDSLHAEIYRAYRKRGKLSRALHGLKRTVEIKKATGSHTTINVRMVVMRQNEHEVARIEAMAKRIGADVFTAKTANPGYEGEQSDAAFVPENPMYRRLDYRPGTWQRIPVKEECRRPWIMANISSNGSVIPCCYDYNGIMTAGNALERPFGEVWEGAAFADLRRQMLDHRDNLYHCSRCLINYRHMPHAMFCNREGEPGIVSPFWRFYGAIRPYIPGPIRFFARRARVWVQGSLPAPVEGNTLPATIVVDASPSPAGESRIIPLSIPMPPDHERGFTSYAVFDRQGISMGDLDCHMSVLSRDISPHPPHIHDEEEILFLAAGEVDLIFPDEKDVTGVRTTRLKANQCVYYPVGFAHSLRTVSSEPANYIMFKWKSSDRQDGRGLPFTGCRADEREDGPRDPGFHPRLAFEGATGYLRKLRCHVSTLSPGAGYDPHADDYHVAIIVLEGEVETLGERVLPYGVIYYAPGEPHGMRNPGRVEARYIVFEFHGE